MQTGKKRFWTIGGGKGGVGKSILTASMGVALARMGKSVVVVDADLGASNLHTYLGIKSPDCTLMDLLAGRAASDEVLLRTAEPRLRLISCAGDILGMANPLLGQKDRIIEFIESIEAEYILVDLGSGTSYNVLDFFNMSDEGVVTVSPDPASMQNAYIFIKSAVYRKIQRRFGTNEAVADALRQLRENTTLGKAQTMMDFYDQVCTCDPDVAEEIAMVVDQYQPLMIINMATSNQDQRVAEIIQSASKKFLNVDIRFCGLVFSDPEVRRSTQRMSILNFDDPNCVAASQIRQSVLRMLHHTGSSDASERGEWDHAPATPIIGLNDNLMFMGKELHIQTEDLGYTGKCITTEVFFEGKVILSTKSQYPERLRDATNRNQIVGMMREQHFNTIREIQGGKIQLPRPA